MYEVNALKGMFRHDREAAFLVASLNNDVMVSTKGKKTCKNMSRHSDNVVSRGV